MTFFVNIAVRLDNFLKKFPQTKKCFCIYFDWSTRFTHFLLFNNIIFYLLVAGVYIITIFHAGELHLYLLSIHSGGFPMVFFGFSHLLSAQMQFILIFCVLLLEIALLNTFLSLFPEIQNYMFELYGNDVLKNRGYNAPTSTLHRVGVVCASCVLAFIGGEVSNRGAYSETLKTYGDSYKTYVQVAGAHATPPQVPAYKPLAETFARVAEALESSK